MKENNPQEATVRVGKKKRVLQEELKQEYCKLKQEGGKKVDGKKLVDGIGKGYRSF